MGTVLCSSPGAVFGRVLFGLRVSPSSTIGFFENFSAMFLGMVVGEVVSRCLPHNCPGSALCYVDFDSVANSFVNPLPAPHCMDVAEPWARLAANPVGLPPFSLGKYNFCER